jgi:hypothetical protein
MADEQEAPDKFSLKIPLSTTPGGPTFGTEIDNVYKSELPQGLEGNVETEWDASSLDKAITWLESHASYLNNLSYEMVDIQQLMGGATGGVGGGGASGMPASPLGSFLWAGKIAEKHTGLYNATEAAVKQLSENLEAAARALREVKENYEKAEERNALSAAEMRKMLSAASGGQA